MHSKFRIVDLFAGCGGLSLGFDAFETQDGVRPYQTVLAMDNWPSAVKVFNRNHPSDSQARLPIGRVADLLWFDHPSEALLYYLVHLSHSLPDLALQASLKALGVERFVRQLRALDDQVAESLSALADSEAHVDGFDEIDTKVFSLAACKSALGKLHLASIRDLRLDTESLPWRAEADLLGAGDELSDGADLCIDAYVRVAADLWTRTTGQVVGSSQKVGRGQHKNNASRMESFGRYLAGKAGKKLKKIWIEWYARRLSLRETFCLQVYPKLRGLYDEDRRAHLVLGGPPCKGFSRIGRAVIRELREQGAHAWACDKFGDERNALMYRYVVFLEALRPDLFLFENVSNFASTLRTPDGELNAPELLEELIEAIDCDGLKYAVDATILSAKEHGVPQARERFFMCGVSSAVGGLDEAKQVLNVERDERYVTLGDALTGLSGAKVFAEDGVDASTSTRTDEVAHLGASPSARKYFSWIGATNPITHEHAAEVDGHIYRRPRADDARLYKFMGPGLRWMDLKTPAASSLRSIAVAFDELLQAAVETGVDAAVTEKAARARALINDSLALRLFLENMSSDLPEKHHLLADGYLSNGTGQHGDWLERLSASKPCKTIVAHIGKDTYGYVHPYEPRPISIREAARIQAFPDWFSFGKIGVVDAYTMIGNAVPPLLSREFASRIWSSAQNGALFGLSAATRRTVPIRRRQLQLEILD